jgi:hypothetical protein
VRRAERWWVRRPPLSPLAAVVWVSAAFAALAASLGVVGADALWLVPLGSEIAHGRLPDSIPYATAPTSGWHDVPAGAQLLFWAAYHAFGGDRGLVLLQAVAAGVALGVLTWGLARRSSLGGALLVSLLVVVGGLPAVAVANVSLFSLALFSLLLALLETESDHASRRIWLALPLIAVWGNLHGAVLAGWALLACYLVLDRARKRPAEAVGVVAGATLAIFLNPVLWHTPQYYSSVFRNEAAKQGVGLWKPLAATPFDVLLVAVAIVFVVLALRGRAFRLWEAVAVGGLAVATIAVARNGVWLLFVAAYPAARALRFRAPQRGVLVLVAAALSAAAVAALAQGPSDPGSRSVAHVAARGGRAVLAEPVLGQQVAVDGGYVWVDNPIDAFRAADQKLYVDWFSGKRRGGAPAIRRAALVLVRPGSSAGRLAATDERLIAVLRSDRAVLYRVRARPSP